MRILLRFLIQVNYNHRAFTAYKTFIKKQAMRIRTHINPFSYTKRYDKQNWDHIFPNFTGIIDVEIGFGYGDFATYYANMYPERSIVGFEINKKLSDCAQEKVTNNNLENAHLVWGNGNHGLEDMFENDSIDRLFVFHPDPWFKSQHIKRRVITPGFLEIAHKKLKPSHCLYLATDVPALWDAMLETIKQSQLFTLANDNEFWDTCYQTKWKERSLEKDKKLFFGTFKKFLDPETSSE